MKTLPLDIALRARLRELIELDCTSRGELCWKVRRGPARAGSPAGCLGPNGYWYVRIDDKLYLAHRIVWALTHDDDPGDRQIDHIDGNRGNNDPDNLRLATHGENCHNGKQRCDNSSGHKGVSRHSRFPGWRAYAAVHGKRITKLFSDSKHGGREAALAAAAAWAATMREELHGEFARHG